MFGLELNTEVSSGVKEYNVAGMNQKLKYLWERNEWNIVAGRVQWWKEVAIAKHLTPSFEVATMICMYSGKRQFVDESENEFKQPSAR